MMKNSKGIFWGSILIIIGIISLLRKLDLFYFQWESILPFWPVLLILAGILLLVTDRHAPARAFVGVLIAFAVFGGIAHRTDRAFGDQRDKWNFNWNDDRDDSDEEEDKDDSYLNKRNEEPNKKNDGKLKQNSYQYEMEDFIQKANFNLEGGAGSFTLKGSTDKLFQANTHSSVLGFLSNTKINKLANSATVDLKMEDGNVKINNGEFSNKARIELNTKPIWTIDLGLGAGKGDFDLSTYKVESLKVSTGVADLTIRMGDKLEQSSVQIEAGVASIDLEIPKSMGCEVVVDGALNLTSFADLEKINDILYRSPGFEKSDKKITINFKGGLSKVKINRY